MEECQFVGWRRDDRGTMENTVQSRAETVSVSIYYNTLQYCRFLGGGSMCSNKLQINTVSFTVKEQMQLFGSRRCSMKMLLGFSSNSCHLLMSCLLRRLLQNANEQNEFPPVWCLNMTKQVTDPSSQSSASSSSHWNVKLKQLFLFLCAITIL